MFSRNPKPGVLRITSKVSIPASLTLTGTISSSGTLVTGSGTFFKTEIKDTAIRHPELKYRYIFDINQAVVREISHVLTDTTLILKEAFPINMTSQALHVPDTSIEYTEVSILSNGAGNYVDGVIVPASSIANFKTERQGTLTPIGVDGTPAGLSVQTLR